VHAREATDILEQHNNVMTKLDVIFGPFTNELGDVNVVMHRLFFFP
jgi:hypothetical protein